MPKTKKVKRDTGNLDDGERHSCHVHGSGLVCRLSFTLVPFCFDRSAAEYKFCCPCFVQSVMIFLFGISTVTFGMPTVFFYIIVSFTLACPAAQTKFLRNSISSSLHLFSTMPTYFNQKLWVVCRHMVPSTDPGIFNVWRKFALFCVGGWFG